MSDVFILKNQHGQYYSKSGEWISEGDTKSLFRCQHADEIINLKVEISVKDPSLRVERLRVETDPKGNLNIADLPKAANQSPFIEEGQVAEAE